METVVRRQKSLRVNLDRNIISRSKMVRLTHRTNQHTARILVVSLSSLSTGRCGR